jgi:hypothetical protein
VTAAGSVLGELRPWILGDDSARVASKAIDGGFSPAALVAALRLVRDAPAVSDPAAVESLRQAVQLLRSSILAGDGCASCGPDTADERHAGICGRCSSPLRRRPVKVGGAR